MPWAKQYWRPGDQLERRRTWFTHASSAPRLSVPETRAGAGCSPHVHAHARAQEAWKRAQHQDAAAETPANAHHGGTCETRGRHRRCGLPFPHPGLLLFLAVRFLVIHLETPHESLRLETATVNFCFFSVRSLQICLNTKGKAGAGTEKKGGDRVLKAHRVFRQTTCAGTSVAGARGRSCTSERASELRGWWFVLDGTISLFAAGWAEKPSTRPGVRWKLSPRGATFLSCAAGFVARESAPGPRWRSRQRATTLIFSSGRAGVRLQ